MSADIEDNNYSLPKEEEEVDEEIRAPREFSA